jgi:DNA-directed RNA polymerase subunit H (RpoH/RPB5)
MYNSGQLDMCVSRNVRASKELVGAKLSSVPNKTKLYVYYNLFKPLSEALLSERVSALFDVEGVLNRLDTLVVVIKEDKINANLEDYVRRLWEDGIYVIVYPLQRLQFDVTAHRQVPLHEILPEESADEGHGNVVMSAVELRRKFNVSDDLLLPHISRTDPVAKAIFIRPGEICRITRPSKTISTIYYRVCT